MKLRQSRAPSFETGRRHFFFFFFGSFRGFCSAGFVFSAHGGHARDSMTSTAPSSFRRKTFTARISGLQLGHHTPPQSRAHAVGDFEATSRQFRQRRSLHPSNAEFPTHTGHFEVQEVHQIPSHVSHSNQGSFDSCAQVGHKLSPQPRTSGSTNEPKQIAGSGRQDSQKKALQKVHDSSFITTQGSHLILQQPFFLELPKQKCGFGMHAWHQNPEHASQKTHGPFARSQQVGHKLSKQPFASELP